MPVRAWSECGRNVRVCVSVLCECVCVCVCVVCVVGVCCVCCGCVGGWCELLVWIVISAIVQAVVKVEVEVRGAAVCVECKLSRGPT